MAHDLACLVIPPQVPVLFLSDNDYLVDWISSTSSLGESLMVFSSLLGGDRSHHAKLKPSRSSTSSSKPVAPPRRSSPNPSTHSSTAAEQDASHAEYISDESQLLGVPDESPDLRELNNSLEALAVVFPNVQIEVFREMLASFEGQSRLALVADALLKNRVAWVKGRWRVVEPLDAQEKQVATSAVNGSAARGSLLVPASETFRSGPYKDAVKALAWHEFKGLSRSTINAVLAECNYAYLDARVTLTNLSSRSWRFAISSLFFRRKPVTSAEAQNHPLVTWKQELYDALVRPLREKARQDREVKDKELAQFLNNEEAAETDATHECCCCFTDGAFEEFTSCSVAGHLLCYNCVQHSLSEAVFGQGWHSVDEPTGTLKCMAVEGDGCTGRIPSDHLHRAMLDMPKGADILHRFDRRLAEQSLVGAQLRLVHCPFCSYAEVDDVYLPQTARDLTLRPNRVLHVIVFLRSPPGPYLAAEWQRALQRRYRRRRGPKFTCLNPACARASCLSCNKSWEDIHHGRQARVPRCNTSFVKNAGCNKLRCPCGYKMCYVCRKDIGEEGYRHFCDHFRPDGDPKRCTECSRCNLWEADDTELLLRKAKEDAEKKWMEREKRALSGAERKFLETGFSGAGGRAVVETMLTRRRIPTLPEFLDTILELMFY
ncbi:unnamed protein product [Parascedosporium putredinis]|uniref:RING-type domain-containing protein n=2 Tax=Parascedosporium putredinis TaxID=1442378 RepID=A0A9P1GUN6_9PEZI|nr:unnamed protein product [Parascedosporium putredinis]CAI7987666.1 unnamed protein product [Parascedosporium putredinis]